jgi:hypothetical protein
MIATAPSIFCDSIAWVLVAVIGNAIFVGSQGKIALAAGVNNSPTIGSSLIFAFIPTISGFLLTVYSSNNWVVGIQDLSEDFFIIDSFIVSSGCVGFGNAKQEIKEAQIASDFEVIEPAGKLSEQYIRHMRTQFEIHAQHSPFPSNIIRNYAVIRDENACSELLFENDKEVPEINRKQ